jgi:hypothetical protein
MLACRAETRCDVDGTASLRGLVMMKEKDILGA